MKNYIAFSGFLLFIKRFIYWLIILLAVTVTVYTVLFITTSESNGHTFFEYKLYVVQTDSMSKTDFKAGDLIISKEVDINTIREGDIITFVSDSFESYGKTVTHKVRNVTKDINGNRAFETYGTTTGYSDSALATKVLGKYVGKISGFGKVVSFLRIPIVYMTCVFIPITITIIYQLINIFKTLKNSD